MNVVLFCHSLLSDWNHGNAHFLRGVVGSLRRRGHRVRVFEPRDAWSVENLIADAGALPLDELDAAYPGLRRCITRYDVLDLDEALDGADLVVVHEWNDPSLVAAIGRHRARGGRYRLLFHDTHHRSVTAPDEMARYDLSAYDGVLAFGEAVRQVYLDRGVRKVWTWHEAADVRTFRPMRYGEPAGDVVWIGNWGDEERTAELREFLLGPAAELGLRGLVHGVRYPDAGQREVARAGLGYAGWLPNFRVPEIYGHFRFTVHVPRRPYARALPGIPTIRVFEALACGIPLVCAPWSDAEGLFQPGEDFLVARDGREMVRHMRALLSDPDLGNAVAACGRATVLARHTCDHRVDELLDVHDALGRCTASAMRAGEVV